MRLNRDVLPLFHPSTLSFILLHFACKKMTSELINGEERVPKSFIGQLDLLYWSILYKINFCHIGPVTRYKPLLFSKLNAIAHYSPQKKGEKRQIWNIRVSAIISWLFYSPVNNPGYVFEGSGLKPMKYVSLPLQTLLQSKTTFTAVKITWKVEQSHVKCITILA